MKISAKRLTTTLFTLTTALLLAACASKPPKTDVDFNQSYDFMKVQKIAFYQNSAHVSGDNPLQLSDMQVDRINEALGNAVSLKGFKLVEDANEADLLLSWHLATQDKTDVRTYNSPNMSSGMGYGRYGGYNRYSMYNCWNCSNTEVRVSEYTEGTFIVDMIDPNLKKSVWRGVTQSKLKGEHSSDQGKYNAAAIRMLEGFPPL